MKLAKLLSAKAADVRRSKAIGIQHRVETHGRWRVRQPEPGVWIWRSPHDAHYLISNAGTYNLGDGPFARRVWRAAVPPDAAPSQTE